MEFRRIKKIMIFRFAYMTIMLILASITGVAKAEVSIIAIATAIAQNSLVDGVDYPTGAGEKICLAGGRPSYDCNGLTTMAQGICLSGERPSYDCNGLTTMGQGICLAGGRPSYDCNGLTTMAQGICLAGGRPSYDCNGLTTMAQGICLSTGRPSYECASYLKPAEGLCLAKGQPSYKCSGVTASIALSMEIIDVFWAWDNFYDEYKTAQWRCRGRSTAQFADDEKCAGKAKVDNTWPRKSAPTSF
jgi:hypothetical protein